MEMDGCRSFGLSFEPVNEWVSDLSEGFKKKKIYSSNNLWIPFSEVIKVSVMGGEEVESWGEIV